ncbi:MAG: AmmeMemoRadiSam system protein B [Bacteroidota bacterium]|nr:AmmeMemoRadiSam system protein B [Bacteroidota bacterium]
MAAGRFYSADKETLINDISSLFEECVKTKPDLKVRALISPHAGYVYSGKVAASAYSCIDRNAVYKNIFIIGSSHIMAFEGASVYSAGDFITPLGRLTVNKEIANTLKNNKLFDFTTNAHLQEHSLEVQMPFVQYHFKNIPPIVPIILGTNNTGIIKKLAEALKPWFTPDNLFIISSDFSHYPSYKTAVAVDNATASAIVSKDPQQFLDVLRKNSEVNDPGLVTSMCGWTSGLLLLYLAGTDNNLEFRKIDYCNSGDSRLGNKDEVVGYNAIVIFEKNRSTRTEKSLSDEIIFTDSQKDELIAMARNNIRSLLYDNKKISVNQDTMCDLFKKPLGAFVTLKIDGALRGCIGRFISSDPLYEVVLESSQSSAFEDPRFTPLTKTEFSKTNIEITVLGPLKKINNIDEIVLGKHGIYIKKDFRSGTMLPQVAIENKWTVEEFLGYTSLNKAGIGWDGWKNADIYTYEGIVLEEDKK